MGSNQLFDLIRKKWVTGSPEERIRQGLIKKMLESLGYPLSYLAVEKEFAQLPHLQKITQLPKRRADIIVFSKEIHPNHSLFPLLVIECKAVPLTSKFIQQIVGYNALIQAPYLALANQKTILTGHFDHTKKHYHFELGLPTYQQLRFNLK